MVAFVALLFVMMFALGGHVVLTVFRTRLQIERLELDARRRWERFEWRDGEGRVQEGTRRVRLRPARERFAGYRPDWSDEDAAGPFDDYEPGQWR
jgi:hypothetical protein